MNMIAVIRCIAMLMISLMCIVGKGATASTPFGSEFAVAYAKTLPQESAFATHADLPPVALLYDCSQSSAPAPVRLKARERIASLLSTLHPNTQFFLVSFNRQPRLIYHGFISPQDGVSALTTLDSVKHSGTTDLGAAIDFVLQQPAFEKGGSVAIISDLYISPPSSSKFSGKPLLTLIEDAHARSIQNFLLVPVGAWDETALLRLPTYVQVLGKGETPARWADAILPPKPVIEAPPVKPFWAQGAFQFSAALTLALLFGALVARDRRLKRVRQTELLDEVSAPGMLFEETPVYTKRPQAVRPAREPVFQILTIEEGREIKLVGRPFVIGASPTATRYLPDAQTTLTLSAKPGARTCNILNSGDKPIYVGRKLLQPREVLQLPAEVTAQCRMTEGITVAIFSTIEGEERNEIE